MCTETGRGCYPVLNRDAARRPILSSRPTRAGDSPGPGSFSTPRPRGIIPEDRPPPEGPPMSDAAPPPAPQPPAARRRPILGCAFTLSLLFNVVAVVLFVLGCLGLWFRL